MGLSSSRSSVAERSTCYRVANFNTHVENFISFDRFAIFFIRVASNGRSIGLASASECKLLPFPSRNHSSSRPMTAILVSRECIFPPLSFFLFPSIFKQFLDAAFALFSRIASVTFAGGHDLTSVKIMSSMQQWRCAVLGILRLKRFAFSPLPRNLHRRPNVQHEPNVERASCECDILDIPFQIASRRSIRGKM